MSDAAWFLAGCMVGGCVAVVAMCLVDVSGDWGRGMKTIQPASAPTPQEFGLRLYGMIERRGMTVTEFARRMGVSSAAAYFWVSGKRFPQMALLWEIRRVLGVPWSELLGVGM